MKPRLKSTFAQAAKFKENGDLCSARKLLLDLIQDDPSSPALFCSLGDVSWEMKLLDEARTAFRHALVLAPSLEAASLGLFHCLWEGGMREEALEEIKRHVSIADCPTYMEIIREINQNSN